jgi:hypothetical protein
MVLQPFGPWPLFSLLILYSAGRTPWTGICPSQGRYLHTEQHKHRINAHRHACFKWDSNPRSQCSSTWRRFMPYTALPLWSSISCSSNLKMSNENEGTTRRYIPEECTLHNHCCKNQNLVLLAICFHFEFLFRLFFYPEDVGDMFFRNVGWLLTDYRTFFPTRLNSSVYNFFSC